MRLQLDAQEGYRNEQYEGHGTRMRLQLLWQPEECAVPVRRSLTVIDVISKGNRMLLAKPRHRMHAGAWLTRKLAHMMLRMHSVDIEHELPVRNQVHVSILNPLVARCQCCQWAS